MDAPEQGIPAVIHCFTGLGLVDLLRQMADFAEEHKLEDGQVDSIDIGTLANEEGFVVGTLVVLS